VGGGFYPVHPFAALSGRYSLLEIAWMTKEAVCRYL
jgi:hypothetical protein